jgi:hypothetical protein
MSDELTSFHWVGGCINLACGKDILCNKDALRKRLGAPSSEEEEQHGTCELLPGARLQARSALRFATEGQLQHL